MFNDVRQKDKYEFVRDYLAKKLLENPQIIKVIFGTEKLKNLERDYGIHALNVKDIIFYWHAVNKNGISVNWNFFMNLYCSDRMEPEPVTFEWDKYSWQDRPLNQPVLDRLAFKTQYLVHIFQQIVMSKA